MHNFMFLHKEGNRLFILHDSTLSLMTPWHKESISEWCYNVFSIKAIMQSSILVYVWHIKGYSSVIWWIGVALLLIHNAYLLAVFVSVGKLCKCTITYVQLWLLTSYVLDFKEKCDLYVAALIVIPGWYHITGNAIHSHGCYPHGYHPVL